MLKGQAKTDYQREYQRKHQKDYRLKRKGSNQSLGSNHKGSNQRIPGLIMKGNVIFGVKKEAIPLYNPAIHKTGDRVLIKPPYGRKLIEVTLPETDADGNPIYEG